MLAFLNYVYGTNESLAWLNHGNNTHGRFILTTHLKQFLDTKFGSVKLRALKTQTTKDQKLKKLTKWLGTGENQG